MFEPRTPEEHRDPEASSDGSAGEVLTLISDDYACEIMRRIYDDAKPARVLAEEMDTSRPTIYRRLNDLRDAGLVEAQMQYESDGHHREVFSVAIESAALTLGDDGFVAELSASDAGTMPSS